ncbi:alkaline phosphatase D family protein [Echinimonas agarilytica]|uniref:Alkaline phosphatase D family protein n=1 Tax=Echinimonas agarilytica TaxID=1215918 RepID=A0AA41W3Y0_9GAMM|nr:alkaline phosphatase D family protein [Echinimonas agarilytica]MCM2678364.1 alkaline phosphatase D family protein [Echinimonas agarilytica]
MTSHFSRRDALKILAAGVASTTAGCVSGSGSKSTAETEKNLGYKTIQDQWHNRHDRVWLGGEYWANPMEDWRIKSGGAECVDNGGNRSVHSLTHQLVDPKQSFKITARAQQLDIAANDGGASIRIGVRSELNEYRSNCFALNGVDAGVVGNEIVIGDKRGTLKRSAGSDEIELVLIGTPQVGSSSLRLEVRLANSQELIGELEHLVAAEDIVGNVAVVSNFSIPVIEYGDDKLTPQGRYRFADWTHSGAAFASKPEQKFGPILWTMYTLSDSRSDEGFVMSLSALTGPMGAQDKHTVELQIQRDGIWQSQGEAQLDPDAWTATFRIANWDETLEADYRVVYREQLSDGTEAIDVYPGKVQANPVGRPLRMAGLTCQNDYAFPYEPVANNVVNMNPDLVFFSGDQLYESHGGFGVVRAPAGPAILNYLRKFYQFGWAFREAMRNQPTICLPDDHDVLQGNLWGEGGAPMPERAIAENTIDKTGGYIEPIRMVNAVHLTHTAHHMKPHDPTPSLRGMSVYYGEMIYGDVSFAIVADRQWKSGPEHLDIIVGTSGNDEEPNEFNPKFDREDLQLLGQRQEQFLEQWSDDWRGHKLKVLLSQTILASLATHQWKADHYLKYDFDSNGWPATARNRAIQAIKKSQALHLCGDTHLPSLSQYGIEAQRDSNWVFCTPAIAVGWQRWWLPDSVGLKHQQRPSHGLPNTGEYLDSFGNRNYVYAVGNPIVSEARNRYVRAHEKSSGFGFVYIDTEAKTYTLEAYKFMVDATDGKASNQFDGWPVTIHQRENRGDNKLS